MKTFTFEGRRISRIALGTASFGGQKLDVEKSFEVADAAREKGVNVFDTARVYGFNAPCGRQGYSEYLVGRYLRERGCRDEIFLVTKGGHPPVNDRNISRLDRKNLEFDVEKSLEDLNVDSIDLYFLHRDHPQMDLAEVMETLHGFVQKGYVKALGASNWRPNRIAWANEYARTHGLTPFAASQVEWNMARFDDRGNTFDLTQFAMRDRDVEDYRRSGLLVMCYTSQAHGLFSKMQEAGGYDALAAAGGLRKYTDPDNRRRGEAVEALCRKYGISPAALGMAYLTSYDFPVMPIISCSRIEQLLDSLSAPDVELTEEDFHLLLGDYQC